MLLAADKQNEKVNGTKKKIKDELELQLMLRREELVKRTNAKVVARLFRTQREESIQEKEILHADDYDNFRRQEIEQTHKLAKELLRRKNEERQENVKAQSNQGSVIERNPSRCAIEETRSRLVREKVCLEAKQTEAVRNWYEVDELEHKEKVWAEERKSNYRRDLQDQLIEHRRKLREEAEEKQRERKALEEAALAARDEDMKEEKCRNEQAERLRAEKNSFLEARQVWTDKRKQALEDEHRKIGKIIMEKETEQKKLTEKKMNVRAIKDAIVDKIARKMVDDECIKQEREDICNEMYRQEKLAEWADEPKKAALKKERVRKEFLDQMVREKMEAAERKAREDAIDAAFSRYLDEERQRVDRIEEKKASDRWKKNMQYGKDLLNNIKEERVEYASGILRKQLELEKEKQEAKDAENKTTVDCTNKNILSDQNQAQTRRIILNGSNSEPITTCQNPL